MNESITSTPAPTVLAGIKAALRPHAPFAMMSDRDLDRLVCAAHVRYFAPQQLIALSTVARPTHAYIIKQGTVRGERASASGGAALLWELGAGDVFPIGALLANRGVTSIYRATDDAYCLEFPAAVFDSLVTESAPFADFCRRRLAYLLDLSRAALQAEYSVGETSQLGTTTPLPRLVRKAPVTASAVTRLGDVLTTMEDQRIGSIPIVDEHGRPQGIFTRQDVIGRVVLPGRDLDTPIGSVMSAPAITLPATATAGDAAHVMAQRGIRHIVVTGDAGEVAGVVSERDLFAALRLSARELSSVLRRASDVSTLAQCAADIRALSHVLVAQGVEWSPDADDLLLERPADGPAS